MGNPVTVKRVPETLVFRPSHTGQVLVQSVQILNVPVDGILTATLASGLSGGPFTIVSISNYDVVRITKTGQPTGDMTLVAETDGKTPLRVRKGQLVEIFVQLTVPDQVSGTLTDRLIVSGDHNKGSNGWTFSVPLIALIVNVTVDFPDFDIHPAETKSVPVTAFSSGLVPLSSITLHYVPKPFDSQFSIADITLTFQGGKATALASVVCAVDADPTFHYLVFEASDPAGDPFDSFTVVATVVLPRPSRWEFVGPQNYVRAQTGISPVSGRVNAIAFDPNPQRPGTWYLGAAMGGLWKTTNYGGTWTPLGDRWKFLPVSSIAVDPSDSNTIYVGTGDVPKLNEYAMGVMKSVDGGQTWSASGLDNLAGAAVSRVLVDPNSPNKVWATTFHQDRETWSGRVWQSLNGGASWTPFDDLPPTRWLGIDRAVPSAGAPDRYYAVGEGMGGELWRTDDGGTHWTPLRTPLDATVWQQRPLIACSPIFQDKVYLFAPPDGGKIYAGTDLPEIGITWEDITDNFASAYAPYRNFCFACSYTGDPAKGTAEDVIYAGVYSVHRSAPGGKRWEEVEGSVVGHADQHAIAVNPFDPNQILVGNDGGIFLANNSRFGELVISLNQNLGITQVYRADYSSDIPPLILAGTQDVGTAFLSMSDGIADWSMVDGGDGGSCAISPRDSLIQYCTSDFTDDGQINLLQTTDGWKTSKDIIYPLLMKRERRSLFPPMICDPNRNVLYVATNYMYRLSVPYRSNGSWLPHLGIQSLSSNGYVNAIALAGDGSWIYTGSNDDELWLSTNSGNTWGQLDSSLLPKGGITWISVHPTNPNDILVGIWRPSSPSRLWRCLNPTDGRIVWRDVSGSGPNRLPNVPVNTIARDPNSPDSSWFVGTDIGVFFTDDGGSNWYNATSPLGLPNVVVSGLKVVSQVFARDLYATTFGRGIWKMTL